MAPQLLELDSCYGRLIELYLRYCLFYIVHYEADIGIVEEIKHETIDLVLLEVLVVPERSYFQRLGESPAYVMAYHFVRISFASFSSRILLGMGSKKKLSSLVSAFSMLICIGGILV
jgi:hypothetical protein